MTGYAHLGTGDKPDKPCFLCVKWSCTIHQGTVSVCVCVGGGGGWLWVSLCMILFLEGIWICVARRENARPTDVRSDKRGGGGIPCVLCVLSQVCSVWPLRRARAHWKVKENYSELFDENCCWKGGVSHLSFWLADNGLLLDSSWHIQSLWEKHIAFSFKSRSMHVHEKQSWLKNCVIWKRIVVLPRTLSGMILFWVTAYAKNHLMDHSSKYSWDEVTKVTKIEI